MQQIYIESYFQNGYSRCMQRLNDILNHPRQKEIENRLKVIDFFDEYGAEATRKAFGKSRSTIYLWKQKLKKASGRLSSLAPKDRAPRRRRTRIVHPCIEDFIVTYRTRHPGVDKVTMTPLVKLACEHEGIKPPSESTVGRIIGDLKRKGKSPTAARVYIHGRSGTLHRRPPRPRMKKMRRNGFYPKLPGDLVEIDTVDIFVDGVKRYLVTAIDLPTRFAFAYLYKTSSSACARDFLGKLMTVAPFPISRVQTDNGHEFLKHFITACETQQVIHYFTYPRHPQSNAHLERFNRTIQEQFAYWHTDLLDEPAIFNRQLMPYLIWYNTEKAHRGIGKIPPLRYYLDNFVTTTKKSNMLWTLTTYVLRQIKLLPKAPYCVIIPVTQTGWVHRHLP
ncbi:MAG: integrase core domain-containing protein [candidate division KSB1 bacterium]|nr:integrase core domain-containing protein [candidate division KSB1 bacterium]